MLKRTFHFMAYSGPARARVRDRDRRRRRPAANAQTPKGPRPEQFTYPPLNFKVPKPSEFRTKLSNGLVVYIAEDHEIPWFNAIADGADRAVPGAQGQARAWTVSPPRSCASGGSTTMTGEQINERMDFLAGTVTATKPVHPHPLPRRRPEDLDGHS